MTPDRIRIAFFDDHPTLLRGLATIFANDRRYVVAAMGASAGHAVAVVEHQRVDVVIIDLSMPGDVFAAIRKITLVSRPPRVIVFTAYASADLALKALDAGALAFVLKGSPSGELTEAIEAVLRGERYVSPELSQRVSSGHRDTGGKSRPTRLSHRERQLLDGLLAGQTNREIAHSLQLTEKTVKHYMTNLMNKLKVKSRLEAVVAARMLGVEPHDLGPEDE